jgi:uncharacterized membrane protein
MSAAISHRAITGAAAIGRQLADQLTITDEDGDQHRCTIAAFVAANVESTEIVLEVLALAPGQSTWGGGGAAPWFGIERQRSRSSDSV